MNRRFVQGVENLRQLFILSKLNLPVDCSERHLLSAGRDGSLLGVPPVGSPTSLYIPQDFEIATSK
jgi:hypothetical protein